MKTLRQFIEENKIRMTAARVDRNPNMSDMPAGSSHWKCVFFRGRSRMTVYFSMGPAHSREPEVADVLDCLASDASGIENARSFEDWASEYGYDADSRKAKKIYKACVKQSEKLKKFIGSDELYQSLLFDTERM
jgi:hypothetical protein